MAAAGGGICAAPGLCGPPDEPRPPLAQCRCARLSMQRWRGASCQLSPAVGAVAGALDTAEPPYQAECAFVMAQVTRHS